MTTHPLTAALQSRANPERAAAQMRFFKCGPGGYAEGDTFIGVPVPVQRKLAKEYRHLTLEELDLFLTSPIHEHRHCALLVMAEQCKDRKQSEEGRRALADFYLAHTAGINNWDLVDCSAHLILGAWLLEHPEDMPVLDRLAASSNLWEQRIAVMATFAFIRAGQFEKTFVLAERLLDHPHDLIHKAVGWMIREIGNRDRAAEEVFLKTRYNKMPRTMLRYAIEKFPEPLRQAYLKGRV